MLNELSIAQRALAVYMSELSEQAYCAGWMSGIEYALWEAVRGERSTIGRLSISHEHITHLKKLSDSCGGWIFFDDDNEESWLPSATWEQRFGAWRESGAPCRESD